MSFGNVIGVGGNSVPLPMVVTRPATSRLFAMLPMSSVVSVVAMNPHDQRIRRSVEPLGTWAWRNQPWLYWVAKFIFRTHVVAIAPTRVAHVVPVAEPSRHR